MVDRSLRIRRLTLDELRNHPAIDIPSHPKSENFCIDNIAATLVRANSSICLMMHDHPGDHDPERKVSLHSIGMDTLRDPKSQIYIQAQVVQLVQTDPEVWAWPPHVFLRVSKPKATKSTSTLSKNTICDLTVMCPGWLCSPVTPEIRKTRELFPDMTPGLAPERAWVLSSENLNTLSELSWSEARQEGIRGADGISEIFLLVELRIQTHSHIAVGFNPTTSNLLLNP